MGGIIESIDMNLGKLWDMVKDREAWRAAVHGVASSVQSLSCVRLFVTPASGPFQITWFFTSGGQSIGVSASTSVLPVNIQD